MQLETADYDWSDWRRCTPERKKRLEELSVEIMRVSLEALQLYHRKLTMTAQMLPYILATGVKGDHPTYGPVVALFANRKPAYDQLEQITSHITSQTPVTHVIYCTTHKLPKNLIGALQKEGADINAILHLPKGNEADQVIIRG